MKISHDARDVLAVAGDIARFRGAAACSTTDVALAMLLTNERPRGELYPDLDRSPSPVNMPYDAELDQLFRGEAEIDIKGLRSVTADARSRLHELL